MAKKKVKHQKPPVKPRSNKELQKQLDEAVRRVLEEYGDVLHKLGKEE